MKQFAITILILSLLLTSCKENNLNVNTKELKKPKNVILLIGDGMGVAQIYTAMSVAKEPLSFEKFKHIGFHKTYSANNYITDSGAGGTALATGTKTNNYHIAADSLGNPLKTILEYAEDNKLATGLVSTSAITHATPASFIAHDTYRYNYENIALDFLDVDIDLFIGGGKQYFLNRKDSLNLIDSLKERNYNIVDGYENLNESIEGKIAVFTADKHSPKMIDGRGDMLPLSTERAINILKRNNNGFFLMVEGSQIDWAGEDNDIDYLITEMLDFEKAISTALEFAIKEGETLVIVTADHETGGLGINEGNLKNKTIETKFTSDYHTGVMVPVFAFGPGAENFSGIYENTEVFEKMMNALQLEP